MTIGAFGTGPVAVVHRREPATGSADLDEVVTAFAAQRSEDGAVLRFSRCRPTAAFSRRDQHLPGYGQAVAVAQEHGFEPVVRPVGGRLAAYDEGSLVVHFRSGHLDARSGLTARFEAFAGTLCAVLTGLGVPDVRIGEVPGEYCSGAWSVNAAGRHKLVGTGQRVNKHGFLFSAVVTVARPDAMRAMLTDTYRVLDLPFTEESVGAVDRWVLGIGVDDLAAALEEPLLGLVVPAAAATTATTTATSSTTSTR